MNTNINALQTLVEALEKRDYITNVSPVREDGVVIEGYVNSLYGEVCKVGDGTFNATAETFVDPTVVPAEYEFYGITVDGTPVTSAEGFIKIVTMDIRLDLKLDNVAYKGVGSLKMK